MAGMILLKDTYLTGREFRVPPFQLLALLAHLAKTAYLVGIWKFLLLSKIRSFLNCCFMTV